ncbi:MAG TPA: sigma-70 family RNA polymerase sigma factor [Chitinophagaceae bacterium]|jgi:RNA polymerase sigma-70 factor (ECF subfamily)|nr:sigma-70 family RNA polymerase sigma factor [Chitinophagaceae bacterium]
MKTLHALADNELIRQFREGNDRAFQELFLRYRTNLWTLVHHYVPDRLQAEDLLQETLIKVCLSLKAGRYNEEGKFLPWCLRIAHNLCMDHLRKPRMVAYVEDFSQTALAAETIFSPEDRFIERQQQAQLVQLIHRLPEPIREVVAYRHFGELSFKEIAARTGAGVNTTLGRMRYGLMHLRKAMKDHPAFASFDRT